MLIQDQLAADSVTDEALAFYRAIGVDCLTVYPPPRLETEDEMLAYFSGLQDQATSHGLRLHNVALHGPDQITMALPGRDAEIEHWCQLIRSLGAAGVASLGYNFKPVGNFRTTSASGRGGSALSTFYYAEYARSAAVDPAKVIDAETLRSHLGYLLERIVPVAEAAGVTLALHPDDPPIPEAMGGAARIVSTLDQYEEIFRLAPSPHNAMLFCQGCVAEMGEDVPRAIERMGSQDKIAYVHFRNIQGSPRSFREVFVDEGQVDMVQAMEAYRDIGFNGPFMMDHTPQIPGDVDARQGHAYAVGYIRALIQAVYR
jgi:mannonate dehydratase